MSTGRQALTFNSRTREASIEDGVPCTHGGFALPTAPSEEPHSVAFPAHL
jgi:hypothetical protein